MVGRSADERLTASWKGKEGLRGQLTIWAENLQQAVDAFGTTGREWADVCVDINYGLGKPAVLRELVLTQDRFTWLQCMCSNGFISRRTKRPDLR